MKKELNNQLMVRPSKFANCIAQDSISLAALSIRMEKDAEHPLSPIPTTGKVITITVSPRYPSVLVSVVMYGIFFSFSSISLPAIEGGVKSSSCFSMPYFQP